MPQNTLIRKVSIGKIFNTSKLNFMHEVEKFKLEKNKNIEKLSRNKEIKCLALRFIEKSDKYKYDYHISVYQRKDN